MTDPTGPSSTGGVPRRTLPKVPRVWFIAFIGYWILGFPLSFFLGEYVAGGLTGAATIVVAVTVGAVVGLPLVVFTYWFVSRRPRE